MPIRNPFARRPVIVTNLHDGNVQPDTAERSQLGFERVDTVGSKASSALSIVSSRSRDNGDYKMSVVNDSGVYLPPSPTDEKGLWLRRQISSGSGSSSDTHSSLGDIEHFSITRESFDSYRRSFDVSARSPVMHDPPRQSLDLARFPRLPRSAVGDRRLDEEPPTPEEGFEDVGLDEQKPKKRGFFAKFGESTQESHSNGATVARFLMPGRKRAPSQLQGAELGTIEPPTSPGSDEAQEAQ